jgi:hypothetical protein
MAPSYNRRAMRSEAIMSEKVNEFETVCESSCAEQGVYAKHGSQSQAHGATSRRSHAAPAKAGNRHR